MATIYVETTTFTDESANSLTFTDESASVGVYSDQSTFKSQVLTDGLREGDHESDDELFGFEDEAY